jgi:hypothetical protein
MVIKMKRHKSQIGEESQSLAALLNAIVTGMGHGGLSYLAGKLGMTPSAMKKRLATPGAGLDEPTMRAVILAASSKAENFKDYLTEIEETQTIGDIAIEIRTINGERVPTWRKSE